MQARQIYLYVIFILDFIKGIELYRNGVEIFTLQISSYVVKI